MAVVCLFERCLCACASYPQLWCRYARYLEAAGDVDAARAVVQRGLVVYCKRAPAMHLFAARFEERAGKPEAARNVLAKLTSDVAPRAT